jgi:RNA polymerase sigma-70 factor (ECF subfamily)
VRAELRGKSSFEAAARQELPVLYRVARRITLNAEAAEDLVGQTLLNAAAGWYRFDGGYVRSWLIQIMRNAHRKEAGKLAARMVTVPLDEADPSPETIWQELDNRMLSSRIIAELDRLPEEFRLAVTLCDMEELSYEQAAQAMEVPIGTVRSRLFRGRRMLRDRLETDNYETC